MFLALPDAEPEGRPLAVKDLFDVAGVVTKLKPGEYSNPVRTQFGIHVFSVAEPTLEEMRPALLAQLQQKIAQEDVKRLRRGIGTRLNLATCYEKIGKLVSAWSLFRDSAVHARRIDDTERHDYALEQAAALLPRLPKLTIARPTTRPPGFTVTRNGVELDLAMLGTALYVDPGPHEVTASAPGFEPFKTTITVSEAEAGSVVIRELTKLKSANCRL